jgi:hypothetical protein
LALLLPPGSTFQLIPIHVDPADISDLQEAILRLSLVNATLPTHGNQENEIRNEETHGPLVSPPGPSSSTATLPPSCMSTSTNSLAVSSFEARSSPFVHSFTTPLLNKRYYVVTTGKCTGVFYNEW